MKKYVMYAWVGAFLILTAMVAAGVNHRLPGNNEFKDAPAQIEGCDDPAIVAVIYSIRTYPDSWQTDNYRMWHGSDVSVWTANQDYGLSLSMNTKDASPNQYEMSDQCRAVLYDTTQTWVRNTLNARLRG